MSNPSALLLVLLSCCVFVVDSQGIVQFYSDDLCTSAVGGSLTLPIGKCFEANQNISVAITTSPTCTDGQAVLYISDQKGCQKPSFAGPVSSGTEGFCLFFTTGLHIGSIAFACVGGSTPSSTTPPLDTVASTTFSGAATAIQTTALAASTDAVSHIQVATSTTTATSTDTPATNPNSASVLSISDKIALAVGLGLGVPSLIVGIVTWCTALRAHQRQRNAANTMRRQERHEMWLRDLQGAPPSYAASTRA
jgi:hypothetical protein